MRNKFTKLIKAFRLIAGQPSLLNHVINADEVWQKHIEKKYGMKQGLPVVNLETLFPEFEAEIPTFAFLDGGSLPTDIALLMKLAKTFRDCSYFEIGTWRGESVVNVAEVAGDCFTLNLSDREMRAAGQPDDYINLTGFFSKAKKNITHLRGNSGSFGFDGLNKKFDLIFIDGDHHYEWVKNDTEKVFAHLVHEDSVVVWHDYARNPETVRHEVLAGILDGLKPSLHQNLFHAGNTLCAVYSRKSRPSHPLKNPVKPDHYYSVTIKSKNTDIP
jgi:predicted O-methyltransferase YrrM